MDDIVLILGMLIVEFFGPVIVAGLVIWGLVAFFRTARLKKSLNASGDNEAALALERLRVKAGGVRFLALLGGAAGLYVGFSITENIVGGLFGMVLGYAPLSSKAASMKQEYGKKFKESVVAPELAKTFDNLVYEPEGVFDADTLRDIQFFKPFSSVTGSDRITAEYKGIHFVQSDVSLLEAGTGSGGQATLHLVSFFRGRVMRFDFADSFSGPVQVVRRDFAEARVALDRG
ncbi:hypothetical protein LJC46_08990, partial [Desulfovibrio sp. OttesenSCG-928-G15]|nr:hypothetical protein [Desulfovibrio sp. OttesenSCG-928-G15]